MKNQRGVTLIALVVTIIVLIILAGVSIAILTGDNGVISRSKLARRNQIEGEVRDSVSLAVQAAKLFSEQKSVTDAGYFADENIADDIIPLMEKDLNNDENYSSNDDRAYKLTTYADGILVTYTTGSYQNATNDPDANIKAYIKITDNTFEFDSTKGDNNLGWDYTPNITE